MLRTFVMLACLLALLHVSGCNKKKSTPQVALAPGAEVINPETGEVLNPATGKMEKSELDPKAQQALEKKMDTIPDEMRQGIESGLRAKGPKRGYPISEDGGMLMNVPHSPAGLPLQIAVLEAYQLPDSPNDADGKVDFYFAHLKKEAQMLSQVQKEQAKEQERMDRGEITANLQPAQDPVGDWRSIGETREGEKHFLVEHDENYYKIMMLGWKDGRSSFQEFRDGKLAAQIDLPYKYNPEKGELITTSASGGPSDSYIVMERSGEKDRIYVRPMYETVYSYTVYKRIGWGGKPPVGITTTPVAPPR